MICHSISLALVYSSHLDLEDLYAFILAAKFLLFLGMFMLMLQNVDLAY